MEKLKKTLKEIAEFVGGDCLGNPNIVITGISGIKEAREGDITFLANDKYLPCVEDTLASAIIVSRNVKITSKPVIQTDDPSLAFAKIASLIFNNEAKHFEGIHPTAILGKNVKLGENIALGPYVVIGEKAELGDNTVIYPNCFIGSSVKIGKDSLIYSNVSIRENVLIGNRVIIHSGTVVGSDGFGFATVKGAHHKIPQIGIVVIEDDVEIGANVTIDRARFDKTIIGRGTKIDNLVQIAHNVVIGQNSIIVAQAGISGSTVIGNNVTIAGQAGLVGHITVGDGAILAAQAGITKSVPANSFVSGYPAKPHHEALRVNACVQNLPKLYETVKELKKKIVELQEKLEGK